jgi:excisionase family DNA binding protein
MTNHASHSAGERLLTVKQVAERLGLSTSSIYRLIDAGELNKVRKGGAARFTDSDVEDLITRVPRRREVVKREPGRAARPRRRHASTR